MDQAMKHDLFESNTCAVFFRHIVKFALNQILKRENTFVEANHPLQTQREEQILQETNNPFITAFYQLKLGLRRLVLKFHLGADIITYFGWSCNLLPHIKLKIL